MNFYQQNEFLSTELISLEMFPVFITKPVLSHDGALLERAKCNCKKTLNTIILWTLNFVQQDEFLSTFR